MSTKGKSAAKVTSKSIKTAPSPTLETPEVEVEENENEDNEVEADDNHASKDVENEENEDDADGDAEENAEENAEDAEEEADAEAEAEENAEEAEEPTKKSTKKASKVTGKKAATKKGGKGGKGGKTKDTDAEDEAHKARMTAAAEQNLVSYFPEMSKRNSNDKWGAFLTTHILEAISHLQQDEVCKDGDYNPFPASDYFQYEDLLKSGDEKKSKGKSVKTKGTVPSKPNVAIKRGQKAKEPEPEPEEEEEEEEVEVDESADAEGDSENKEESENKTPTRKRIVKLSKQAKTYLGFVLTRFVDDFYCADEIKTTKTAEDFTKQVFTKISKDTASQMSRVVVCTVNEHKNLIANYSAGHVASELDSRLSGYFKNRATVFNYVCSYASDYVKLLAYHLAMQLWLSSRAISAPMLETAMRSMALSNHRYMLDNKFIGDDEDDCGLTRGVMQDARLFDKIVNPPPVLTEEQIAKREAAKTKRDEARKAAKAKRDAEREAKGDTKGDAKGKNSKTKGSKKGKPAAKKGKKVVDEPEEAEEENVDAEVEEENVDAEEAEEEPEEEKPKKNVKPLTKSKANAKKTSKK